MQITSVPLDQVFYVVRDALYFTGAVYAEQGPAEEVRVAAHGLRSERKRTSVQESPRREPENQRNAHLDQKRNLRTMQGMSGRHVPMLQGSGRRTAVGESDDAAVRLV